MILYGSYTSPYVRHCRIVLDLSDLEWSFEDTDYAASAVNSPTMRVPFLRDGDIQLTDSTSILKYLADKQAAPFLEDVFELERYAMINTAMDAAINLFLLERDGVTPQNSDYLARQTARIKATLAALDRFEWSLRTPYSTAAVRLGCFLDWALFRQRLDLAEFSNLQNFLDSIRQWSAFADTAPT